MPDPSIAVLRDNGKTPVAKMSVEQVDAELTLVDLTITEIKSLDKSNPPSPGFGAWRHLGWVQRPITIKALQKYRNRLARSR